MPKRTLDQVRATREAVLRRSADVASVNGLDGLSFSQIAAEVGLSKSGLAGYFESKTAWQLAVIGYARSVFREAVIDIGRKNSNVNTPLIVSTCRAWLDYIELPVFPGGCFFAAAAAEFDDREGAVRDAIRETYSQLRKYIAALAGRDADGEGAGEQMAFELIAVMIYLNQNLRLGGDQQAGTIARHSIGRIIGHPVDE